MRLQVVSWIVLINVFVIKRYVVAFIDWARAQVEGYAEMFRNQVYSSGVEGKVVEEALKITYDLSKKVSGFYDIWHFGDTAFSFLKSMDWTFASY